jgi:hypothetical protein
VFARKDEQATRPEFREDPDDPLSRSVVLPPGIVLDAFIDADGQTTSGQRAVFFLPEGLSENVDVRLADRDEETVLVKLSATRGQAQRDDLLEARNAASRCSKSWWRPPSSEWPSSRCSACTRATCP